MLTRRERLMATLRGEPVERPAVSFYEVGGIPMNPDDPGPFNVHSGLGWRELLQLAEEETDLIRMRAPALRPAPGNCMDAFRTVETEIRDGSRFVRTTWRVGGRVLTSVTRQDPSVDTVWTRCGSSSILSKNLTMWKPTCSSPMRLSWSR